MSNHEKAILTYEALQRRKVEKKKATEKMMEQVHYDLTAKCAKRHDRGSRHLGKGVVKTRYISY